MKSFVASLLPVLAALTGCDHPFALVEDGRPAVEIVAPDDAQVRKDVDFFTNAVCRATRAAIPVVGRAVVDQLVLRPLNPRNDAFSQKVKK